MLKHIIESRLYYMRLVHLHYSRMRGFLPFLLTELCTKRFPVFRCKRVSLILCLSFSFPSRCLLRLRIDPNL